MGRRHCIVYCNARHRITCLRSSCKSLSSSYSASMWCITAHRPLDARNWTVQASTLATRAVAAVADERWVQILRRAASPHGCCDPLPPIADCASSGRSQWRVVATAFANVLRGKLLCHVRGRNPALRPVLSHHKQPATAVVLNHPNRLSGRDGYALIFVFMIVPKSPLWVLCCRAHLGQFLLLFGRLRLNAKRLRYGDRLLCGGRRSCRHRSLFPDRELGREVVGGLVKQCKDLRVAGRVVRVDCSFDVGGGRDAGATNGVVAACNRANLPDQVGRALLIHRLKLVDRLGHFNVVELGPLGVDLVKDHLQLLLGLFADAGLGLPRLAGLLHLSLCDVVGVLSLGVRLARNFLVPLEFRKLYPLLLEDLHLLVHAGILLFTLGQDSLAFLCRLLRQLSERRAHRTGEGGRDGLVGIGQCPD
mmetsp:Transcript_9864/g.25280  ORF Transcript_9864/g.25280 Transcript_9864/m.25280 type:complete len:420 (+) Transcript_9864:407-1666(+)